MVKLGFKQMKKQQGFPLLPERYSDYPEGGVFFQHPKHRQALFIPAEDFGSGVTVGIVEGISNDVLVPADVVNQHVPSVWVLKLL